MTSFKVVSVILATALIGGLIKIIGGLLYGSRALFVDALTCFANFVALIATIHYYRISLQPPDTDHPYGHYRLGYAGVIISLIAYGYVAGVASVELLYSVEYTVGFEAVYYAVAGSILYGLTIWLSMRIGGVFKAYGLFTVSELYESLVTIFASIAGALYTYLIDYIGAIGLTIYIFYELIMICRETISMIVDKSAPRSMVDEVKSMIEKHGYQVLDLRIRCIAPNIYHGDVRVKIPKNKTVSIDDLKKKLREKYNLDIVVEAIEQ